MARREKKRSRSLTSTSMLPLSAAPAGSSRLWPRSCRIRSTCPRYGEMTPTLKTTAPTILLLLSCCRLSATRRASKSTTKADSIAFSYELPSRRSCPDATSTRRNGGKHGPSPGAGGAGDGENEGDPFVLERIKIFRQPRGYGDGEKKVRGAQRQPVQFEQTYHTTHSREGGNLPEEDRRSDASRTTNSYYKLQHRKHFDAWRRGGNRRPKGK